ncbi:MAG: hypothetical protein GOU98_02865 [Candidatus Altiarchaeota archaeon]|nr:hypothetical protein [Candidatus Altiarchaeota archaeon]
MGSVISLLGQKANDKTFLLSQDGIFFLSFANGAYGSKWAGLWKNEVKYLEYLAVKAGDAWLSPKNFKNIKYNGISAELIYNNNVTQKMCVTKEGLIVELVAEKPIEWDIEIGVNIRKRDENTHNRDYKLSKRNGVIISNAVGQFKVVSKGASFTPLRQREEHFPGKYASERGYDWQEDPQEKFIAGVFSSKSKKMELNFLIDSNVTTTFAGAKKAYRKQIRKYPEAGWKVATSINQLMTKIEGHSAFFAGFPYFNQFWTRDFLWMVRPLIDAGFINEVQSAMSLIKNYQLNDGSIPFMYNGKEAGADSTPLYIIASDEAFLETGKINGKAVKEALEYGLHNKDKFVKHPANLTWMDTINRQGAIEVQSLWVEAFDRGAEIFDDEVLSDASADVWEVIENSLVQDEVFRDSVNGPYEFTANSLVPVLLGQASLGQRKRTLKKARKELVTDFGIKAVSKTESSNPEKYHERVWGLTTYWGLLSFNDKLTSKILKGYQEFYDSKTLYGMPETISHGAPLGATHQLWSVAFLPKQEEDE